MSIVYLLRHSDKETFKIGKANDVHDRIPSIGGYQAFSLDSSLCVQFSNSALALRVEKLLHQIFKEWNQKPGALRTEGDTEHFHKDCFDNVVSFLKHNQSYFKSEITPIPKIPKAATLGTEERRERRRQKKEERLNELHRINVESFNGWERFTAWFQENKSRVLEIEPKGRGVIAITFDLTSEDMSTATQAFTHCVFDYWFPNSQGGFLYGATHVGYQNKRGSVWLSPLSDEQLSIVADFSSSALGSKIEDVNSWIRDISSTIH